MNRLFDDLDQIIEDKAKTLQVYYFLKDHNLFDEFQLLQYNRFRNNKRQLIPVAECDHKNIVHAAGLSICYDCGLEY
jgi:hypothetical protein